MVKVDLSAQEGCEK